MFAVELALYTEVESETADSSGVTDGARIVPLRDAAVGTAVLVDDIVEVVLYGNGIVEW